jgi:hypothetical protein
MSLREAFPYERQRRFWRLWCFLGHHVVVWATDDDDNTFWRCIDCGASGECERPR